MSEAKNSKPTGTQKTGGKDWLKPAFGSNLQALWFLVLIVFALSLPKIITNLNLVSRAESYDHMPETQGAYSFIKDEIFRQKEDIDVLFIGGSIMWDAVDTPRVQKVLSERLGREAKVLTFGFNFNGVDIPYAQLRDLLERRRVRMVVFSVPRLAFTPGPSTLAYKFLRYDDHPEVVEGLSAGSKLSLYACNVLRSPRDLLSAVRRNPESKSAEAENLGAHKRDEAMEHNRAAFERFTPAPPVFSADRLLFSGTTAANFHFTGAKISPHQDRYLVKLVELLREKRVPLVMLNIPQYSERRSERIIELEDWSQRFGQEIPLIGIAPTVLFAGLSEKEIELLHADREHFNTNGNEFYTQTVLPAILEVYEKHAAQNF